MYPLVSSFIPFPNIYWWLKAADAGSVLFDNAEHFQKMSYRNRYYISGANGLIQLSVPLVAGRNQRCAMRDVQVSHAENWEVQHWRTIVSVYSRTPYFEYYEPGLKKIFDTKFTHLTAFNIATVQWLMSQLKLKTELKFADNYNADYGAGTVDLRSGYGPGIERSAAGSTAPYYQIFADRTGFLHNLSMLDLLFAEGPHTMQWLADNRQTVESWSGKAE